MKLCDKKVITLLLFLASLDHVSCNVFYVVPSQDYSCFPDSCITLSMFADNSYYHDRNSTSNITLFIAGGNHSLDAGFTVSNAAEFSMVSVNDTDMSSMITCTQRSHFNISNVDYANIIGLIFVGCGGNTVVSANKLNIQRSTFIGYGNTTTSLTLIESNVSLVETNFSENQMGSYRSEKTLPLSLIRQYPVGATVGGALVVTNSTLTVDNCHFEGNQANAGGAIFSELESSTIIRNSTFTFNKATNCYNDLCFGGALLAVETGRMMILGTTFENNTSDRDGGTAAIFNATLLVSRCHVYNNTATGYGGTMAVLQSGTLLLEEAILSCNHARQGGGTLYVASESTITINGSTFNNNSAITRGGVMLVQSQSTVTAYNSTFHNSSASSGGVIFATGGTSVTLSYTNVSFNKAVHSGGVIFLTENSTSMIDNSEFWHNEAEHGGVIYVRGSENSVIIHKNHFTFNTVVLNGGVLQLMYGGKVLINESTFENNSANREGGVLYGLSMESSRVYNSTFVANHANIGGVFTLRDGSTFFTQGSVFHENTDSDLGAVIYADGRTENAIHNCNFTDNSGNYGGVVHATRDSNVTVDNCKFENNTANIDGATLYGRSKSIIMIGNSSFHNNIAINDAVMLAFDRSTIELNSVHFTNNKAGHDGGAVYVYDSSILTVTCCTFVNNGANNSGGAIYGRKNTNITIAESIIYNGSAQNSGGAVYAQEDSNVTIESSNFTNNSANSGGVLHIYVRSTAYMTKCRLSENRAKIAGGAMNAYQLSTIQVQVSVFNLNLGDFGGISFTFQNSSLVFDNCMFLNNVAKIDGLIRMREHSTLNVTESMFMNNSAENGGVIYAQNSNVSVEGSHFMFNQARRKGSVIFATNNSIISICLGNFSCNRADNDGGVMALLGGTVTKIMSSIFTGNSAGSNGGVIGIQESSISVFNTVFHLSIARSSGGIMRAIGSSITVNNCTFADNSAGKNGGIVHARLTSNVTVLSSSFLRNAANISGGIIFLEEQSSASVFSSTFHLNKAESKGGVISATLMSKVSVSGGTFSHNIAEKGAALLAEQQSSISFVEGVSLDYARDNDSNTISSGKLWIHNNTALYGGGVYLSDSDLYIGIPSNISDNHANMSGGGIYSYAALNSSIMVNSSLYFNNNQAFSGNGGGIYAQNTSLIFGSHLTVDFISNQAKFGGGINLENSKLNRYNTIVSDEDPITYLNLISNNADYGGALYVDDQTECFAYDTTNVIGCFFQNVTKGLRLNFNNNSANSITRGYDVFGGLIDRCTVVVTSDTDSPSTQPDGVTRFKNISNIKDFDTVYSAPVRVCVCKNNEPDCAKPISPVQVKQGNEFTVGPIAAVDQVGHPVTATVKSDFGLNILPASQMNQEVGTNCSDLTYRVSFPRTSKNYRLTLYAEGPCNQTGISEFPVDVFVLECTCPIGFTRNQLDSRCSCICDTRDGFSKYIKVCDPSTETVIRKGRFWITYVNDSTSNPYFIYPYCPLDYCQPPSKSVSINLNRPDGSNEQCVSNRHGILCGSCRLNYSLSLGSSKCLKCPDNWHGQLVAIVIAAVFAGMILVVLTLWLNLTVATGTLNSIIFYANIIYADRSIYFGQLPLTFIPIFISWLNLDIGFDICFFERMDAYGKTWIQLAFPLYIICLVIIIILICSCSSKFSHLLGKRNPVATLASLILLSYTKLLEIVIISLSSVTLKYPNYTTTRWLPDANVEYGKGKHIALICAAVLILTFGLLYTILITSWQWLLRCSRSKVFSWTRNQKLHSFIDTYHTPHTPKHRYWTGLRLLVRVVVYLISTFTVSIDPRITLLSTAVITCCLLSYKTMFMIRVYKNWLLSVMESNVYFNIIIFTLITWYTFSDSDNLNEEIVQTVAVYLSTGTIFILFVLVFVFHIYRYGSEKLYALGRNSKVGRKMNAQISCNTDRDTQKTSDSTGTLFDVIDSPRGDTGYKAPNSTQTLTHTTPTNSVVSMIDCDKSTTVECTQAQKSPPTQAVGPDQGDGEEGSRAKPPSETLSLEREFEVTRKTRSKLLSFRAQGTSNESITKPLLEEDKL